MQIQSINPAFCGQKKSLETKKTQVQATLSDFPTYEMNAMDALVFKGHENISENALCRRIMSEHGKFSGADANIAGKIKLSRLSYLQLSGAYSYMHAVDDTEGSAVKGEQIIYTPRHSGSCSAALQTPLLNVGYSLLWSGERYRLAQNIPSSRVDGYCDHSVWLSRDWAIGKSTLSTRIEAMNLLDKNYEIIRYYPMPGRSFRLSATINL